MHRTLTCRRYALRLARVLHVHVRRLPALLLALVMPALAAEQSPTTEQSPTLVIQPGTARPGEPVLLTVRGLAELPTGTLGLKPLRFFPSSGGFQALAALPVEQPLGAVEIKVSGVPAPGAAALELSGTLEVVDPGWPQRVLNVSRRFTRPPTRDIRARLEADRAAFAAAYAQPFSPPLFQSNFAWPRRAPITAPFGDLRLFNGSKQSQHFGTDIDGNSGDLVRAANAGTVVLTRDAYTSGQTVLIHHGAGLYTAYFHLSKILVKEGQRVSQGERLGLVGATGRVTGPHLHWGVKVGDMWVDGEALLRLDFFPR